jgi:hypothetical protein
LDLKFQARRFDQMIHKLKAAWGTLFHRRSRLAAHSKKQTRILWIHAGGHKTGSKTIQNYLYLGGLQTTAPGIFYKKMNGVQNPKYMNCGNGLSFIPLPPELNLASKIESFVGSAQEAILSSEEFFQLRVEEWQRLDSVASGKGIEVRVVFFVRDVLPFMLSAYDQGIKGGRMVTGFADFASTADWMHATALRNLATAFPADRLRVRHYDSERHNLLPSFFEAVGVSSPQIAPLAGKIGLLNRSLTREERDLLLFINQKRNYQLFAEDLNRGFQGSDPDAISEKPPIPTDLEEKLWARFAGEVDWINKTFFDGGRIVGLGAETSSVTPQGLPEKQAERSVRLHRTALEIVMQKAVAAAQDHHNRLCWRMETLDRENLAAPDLPKNFDPAAYLLLNQDLVQNNIPLVRHFLDHGRREGRAHSWIPKKKA